MWALTVSNFVPLRRTCAPGFAENLVCPKTLFSLAPTARYSLQKDPLTVHRAVRSLLERLPTLWFVHIGHGELWEQIDVLGCFQADHPGALD